MPKDPQSQANCPPGLIFRRAHTRKFNMTKEYTVQGKHKVGTVKHRKNSATIPGSCVKPKQTLKTNNSLKKGELLKYGYSFRLPDKQRHAALKKAIKTLGAVSVYRILERGAKLSKNIYSDAHIKFTRDMIFVRSLAQS